MKTEKYLRKKQWQHQENLENSNVHYKDTEALVKAK